MRRSPLGSPGSPKPPGLIPGAERRLPPGGPANPGPTHLQLGGRGRRRAVLRGAPPADSARAARPSPAKPGPARPGPARTRTSAAVAGRASWGGGPATRVRVLLTNGPGARGGRRRGSPAWGPARPWSPSAQRKGRRWLLRSPPPSAPPLSPPGGGARGREPGRTRGEGGRGTTARAARAARLELVTD